MVRVPVMTESACVVALHCNVVKPLVTSSLWAADPLASIASHSNVGPPGSIKSHSVTMCHNSQAEVNQRVNKGFDDIKLKIL